MKSKFLIFGILILFCVSCKKDNPGPNEVFMNSMAFSPSSITVSVGTKITWTNKESSVHTVTSNGGTFVSGDLSKDQSFSFTFTTAGTFPYHCAHHSSMTGTVIVQ